METFVQRLENARPRHRIVVHHTTWVDQVMDESSARVVNHKDGGKSMWYEMVCEVITEASLERKNFRDYDVGDILVNRKKVANIYEHYDVSVVKRPMKMWKNFLEPLMFQITSVDASFSEFLKSVSDAYFVKYYDSTPNGFRWAILDFEAHTEDVLSQRFHAYRLFGEDANLHDAFVKCFNERRKKLK